MPHRERDEDLDALVPPGLAEELRRLDNQTIFVPPEVDRSVVSRADRHFHRVRTARRWAVACAVAVVLAVGAGVYWSVIGFQSGSREFARVNVAREDIDGDGRVNVLDAFALARLIEQKRAETRSRFDVNGDGIVDKMDIEHVALKAVTLGESNL